MTRKWKEFLVDPLMRGAAYYTSGCTDSRCADMQITAHCDHGEESDGVYMYFLSTMVNVWLIYRTDNIPNGGLLS